MFWSCLLSVRPKSWEDNAHTHYTPLPPLPSSRRIDGSLFCLAFIFLCCKRRTAAWRVRCLFFFSYPQPASFTLPSIKHKRELQKFYTHTLRQEQYSPSDSVYTCESCQRTLFVISIMSADHVGGSNTNTQVCMLGMCGSVCACVPLRRRVLDCKSRKSSNYGLPCSAETSEGSNLLLYI